MHFVHSGDNTLISVHGFNFIFFSKLKKKLLNTVAPYLRSHAFQRIAAVKNMSADSEKLIGFVYFVNSGTNIFSLRSRILLFTAEHVFVIGK